MIFLSINSMKKILKREGAKVISDKAAIKLRQILNDHAVLISKKAIKNAMFSGRKVIKQEDIENIS